MQKIIVRNFGPVEYAEIEIKKVLVLIGEQASGKSTIAKLIHFFKSLRDEVFTSIYQDKYGSNFAINNNVIFPLLKKFHAFFGLPDNLTEFDITFYYDLKLDKYLNLKLIVYPDNGRSVALNFSDNFFDDKSVSTISRIKQFFQDELTINNIDPFVYEQQKIEHTNRLIIELNDLFSHKQIDLLFGIADRPLTVAFSDLFEKYLFAHTQNRLSTNNSQDLNYQVIDETLMQKFMERGEKIKGIFKQFKSFEGLIAFYSNNKDLQKNTIDATKRLNLISKLEFIASKIYQILKGKYIFDNFGEKIVTDSNMSVYLSNASSGQQSAIRILQDIFICIFEDSKVFRIIEEPENHLFPVAQKHLIELLSLMVNQDDDNQLIITTHSPYVLTVFNNLLFAKRVVDKNPSTEVEVSEIIPQEFWLNSNDFSAYSLGNHFMGEEAKYCESIFNAEKGTIRQNYLDTVSEMLGGDFNALYSIHAKTFGRR